MMTVPKDQNAQERDGCERLRVGSKKSLFYPPNPCAPRRAVSAGKAADCRRAGPIGCNQIMASCRVQPLCCKRSVLVYVSRAKRAGTQLAAFFNGPGEHVRERMTYGERQKKTSLVTGHQRGHKFVYQQLLTRNRVDRLALVRIPFTSMFREHPLAGCRIIRYAGETGF